MKDIQYGNLCKVGNEENTYPSEIVTTKETEDVVDSENTLKEEKQENTIETVYEPLETVTNNNNFDMIIIISVIILILILCVIFIILVMKYNKY